MGINGLAILLFTREHTDSFAVAGAATGAYALTLGLASPVQGRLIDRHGPRRVLPWLVALQVVGVLAFVALGIAGAPGGVLVGAAGVAGLGQAPWSSVMRAMWPRLLGDAGLVATAFALDAAVVEVVFIAGPLLVGLATALFSPQLALVLSTAAVTAGGVLFLRSPAIRAWENELHDDRHLLGALRHSGLRTVVIVTLPIGFCFGALEVALPAFASDHGSASSSGLLIACWAAGSAMGGVLYGARDWASPLPRQWVSLIALLAASLVPLLAAPSLGAILPLLLLAGAGIAPTIASGSRLLGQLAPPGMGTEAYAWGPTAIVVGAAVGSAAGGALAEAFGWRAATGAAIAVSAAGAALAFACRGSLLPAAGAAPASVAAG